MIDNPLQEGTPEVNRSGRRHRVKVSADGRGVVSHAGTVLLRELATETGLAGAVSAALLDTYRGIPRHMPGQVFADLAVAIADGADAVSGIGVLRDRQALFGPVASMPTAWRLLDRIDEPHLERVRAARAAARERAWAGGAAPQGGGELRIDFDATISIAFSEKENAAATWKKTFGFHPLLAFLDRPEVAGGEALAGLLRPGNAGSNTAADHVQLLDMALAALPAYARPRPGDPVSPRVLARSDSAGATHAFATACRKQGVEFSFGFPVDERVQNVVGLIPDQCWHPARRDLRAGGRAGAAAPPARPGRRPHPRWQGRRAAGLPVPGLGGKPCLAGGRARRRRPDLLGQADLLRPHPRAGPLRDRRLPLPGPARGRPANPLRPPHLSAHRPQLAVGHPHRRRLPPPRRPTTARIARALAPPPAASTTTRSNKAPGRPLKEPRERERLVALGPLP